MVLPIILGVALAVVTIAWLITWFRQPPKEENETMREAQRRAAEEEEKKKQKEEEKKQQEETKRERDRYAAELEKQKERLEKLEREERKRKEQEEQGRKEQEKKEQEEKDQEKKWKEEKQRGETKPDDSKKAEKEADTPIPVTELQYDLFLQRQELKDCEAQLRAKEADLLEQTRLAHESARTAQQQHDSGRQPTKWPTAEELQRGRDLVQYNVNNVHFAIVGKSGSGKSSLINAFLNLRKGQPGAAATGVTETTAAIGRYPDPGIQPPRPWTVWYDVPGAGTQNVSAWQYFINQGLFVFDVILLAIGDRFEETDVQLLRDCHRFKIPALIVRSKADMHIDNLIKEEGGGDEPVDRELYRYCRDTFVTESKKMVRDELAKAQLDDQVVYLVSCYSLRKVYNRSLDGLEDGLPRNLIDEKMLIRDLMLWTVKRRGGDNRAFQMALQLATQGNGLRNSAAQAGRAIRTTIRNATGHPRNPLRPDRALQEGHVDETDAPPEYQEEEPEQNTSSSRPSPPSPNNRNQTPFLVWTKRVVYLPRPVTFHQLQQDLNARNPDLARVSTAPPRMLSGTVVVLNFLPGQSIPDKIEMFGQMLTLQPYREPNTNPRREQSRPTATHSQTSSTSGCDKPAEQAKKNSGYRSPTVEEVEDEAWQFLDDLC